MYVANPSTLCRFEPCLLASPTFSIGAVVFLLADTFHLKCTGGHVPFPQGHRSQVSAYRQSLKYPQFPAEEKKKLDSPTNDIRHVHSLAKR